MFREGEQFLHKRDSQLHTSGPVEHEKYRKEMAGEETSQKPVDKIADWLKVIEKTHLEHRDDPRVLERIKEYYHDQFVIKPEDVPESYYENQKRIAREQGHGDIEIPERIREQGREVIINDQKSTLDNWVDYFISHDSESFPMWAKYWAFNGMLKLSTFDKEKHVFGKRDKNTVAPFPDLNREALAYVIDAIIKKAKNENIPIAQDNPELQKLLEGANFGKLYIYAIEKVTPTETNELLKTEGEWVRYPQESDHMPLVESLQGYGTGWCTAGENTAKAQLESGDFYVYYSHDKEGNPTIPRAAIRMEGENIAEVRGIGPQQNLDPYISDVVEKKLVEFPDGQAYKKKTADMKRLTEIEKRNLKGEELTKEDLRFLYQLDTKIEGFGYGKDPRIEEILKKRDIKSDLSLATGYSKEQISTTGQEAFQNNIEIHYGDIFINDFDLEELSYSFDKLKFPKIVTGSISLSNLNHFDRVEFPEEIKGNLGLGDIVFVEGIKLPKIVGGNLDLGSIESAVGLELPEVIDGNLYLGGLESPEGLKLPKKIGGTLYLSGLKSAEGLELPEVVGGSLILYGLESAKGLKLPKTIGGELDLNGLESQEGLELPETVNGNLGLNSLKSVKGLKLPKIVKGYLHLSSLESTNGLELPEILGGLSLGGIDNVKDLKLPRTMSENLNLVGLTSAEGLEFPETVGGTIYLNSLESAKGLKLPKTVGGGIRLNALKSAEGLELPEIVNGDLDLRGLIFPQGLKLPRIIKGDLLLNGLKSAEGLEFPETVNGELDLNGLVYPQGLKLPRTIKGNLSLNGLKSVEGLEFPETVGLTIYLNGLPRTIRFEEIRRLRKQYPELAFHY
ncbi:MAG: hypothetical protein WC242_00330 [Candidatus Paceibacterota bacterium]|jgi:hypothetical protein